MSVWTSDLHGRLILRVGDRFRNGRLLSVEVEPRRVPDPFRKSNVQLLSFGLLGWPKRVVGPERKTRPLQQASEAGVALVGQGVKAAGEQVLAIRHVGVALVLVRRVPQALVDAALEQH